MASRFWKGGTFRSGHQRVEEISRVKQKDETSMSQHTSRDGDAHELRKREAERKNIKWSPEGLGDPGGRGCARSQPWPPGISSLANSPSGFRAHAGHSHLHSPCGPIQLHNRNIFRVRKLIECVTQLAPIANLIGRHLEKM